MAQRHRRTALERLGEATRRLEAAEADRRREIARAIHHGATWAEVGNALGVSAQSAHRRYRHVRWDPVTQQVWQERPLPLR